MAIGANISLSKLPLAGKIGVGAFAVILVAVFAVRLGWFPTSGLARITEDGLWANLRSLALPAITLMAARLELALRHP